MKRDGIVGCLFVSALSVLAGCGNRQASVDAALALAEHNYPGRLELHDAHLQKDHYDVVLAIRGDPYTRVRFGVDRDPAECTTGSPCEVRLQRAYAIGVAGGTKLGAVDRAFRQCGVPALAIYDAQISTGFRTAIELPINAEDPQPGLDRLTPCIAAFRDGLPSDADDQMRALNLLLVPQQRAAITGPDPLTFEARLPTNRLDDPTYMVGMTPDVSRVSAQALRLNPHYVSRVLNQALSDEARRVLDADPIGAHVPQVSFPRVSLDDRRLDIVHAYVLACSVRTPGAGPCRTDVAVKLRYDLTIGQTLDAEILRDIRDDRGEISLPDHRASSTLPPQALPEGGRG